MESEAYKVRKLFHISNAI